jgi:hypothetical protein
MTMARVALAVSSLLLASACSGAGVTAAPSATPLPVQPGQPFALKAGQVAAAADGLRIGLDGVSADSRCPKGEQCVWAGDATVHVWWQQAGGARQSGELHTAPGRAASIAVAGRSLRLLRLEPWPVSGRPIAPVDHVAHLLLDAAGPAEDRSLR